MSIFGKLFKKKDEEFSFDSNENFSATNSFSNPDPLAPSQQNTFGNPTDPLSGPTGQDTFGGDPFSASGPSQSAMSQGADPFEKLSQSTSFQGSTIPNTTGMPSATPLPPLEAETGATTGSQIARDYIRKQQAGSTQQPSTTITSGTDTSLEMINLKLDAIRSQLETLNHRIAKLEHEPKRLWK